jgi:uncharacterized membrane protein YhfC
MNLVARILNFTLMIAMPFGLAVYLFRKFRTPWRLFGIGILTFLLSQVGHLPFNHWLLNPLVDIWGLDLENILGRLGVGLLYGLSAGLFEEITRYLGYRFWLREDRSWSQSLMFGAGHGGIESILLGAVVLFAFIQAIVLRDVDLSTVVEPDQVELAAAQLAAYWEIPWHLAILGAVERLAAIAFHLSATVLVLQTFTRRNLLWLLLAIGWHTLLNAVAVFAAQTWSPYLTEVILLGFGLMSLGIVLWLRTPPTPLEPPTRQDGTNMDSTSLESPPPPPSEESLEDSRYM